MLKKIFFSVCFLMGAWCSYGQKSFVIEHVNVIPMDREVVLKDQSVVITNGKITAIGSKVNVPKDAVIIDGQSKYLIPGLTDMHAHFFYEQGIDKSFIPQETKMMLAEGVTTARIMNGGKLYQEVQHQIAGRKAIGPELFVMSPQLVGAWPWTSDTISPHELVTNAEEATAAVKKYKREGYDAIKITFYIKKPAYDAVIKTAREEGLKVAGHIGHDVKLPAALAAKQQIEHLDEFMEMLLPDTSSIRYSVSGPSIWDKKAWQTVDYLDENKIPALVRMVKEAGVYISPTNYFFKVNFAVGQTEEEIRNLPDYPFIPSSLLPERADARNNYWNKRKIEESKRLKWYGLRTKIIKGLYEAGVPLLCGSDSPEWYLVQGFSVHHELQNLAECGLSNYAALQTSTVNPCKYLGIDKRKGTVAVGKDADLVLLDKNPLENINNTTSIRAVFRDGHFYDRAELDKLLKEVLAAENKN